MDPEAPAPVVVLNPEPLPVIVTAVKARPTQSQQDQLHDPSLVARTTFQEDLTTAGQRKINLIWEYTQATVALLVVIANMVVGVYQGLLSSSSSLPFPTILSSSLFLIVGFYFSRTNHAAIGGVGAKPTEDYRGR